MRGKWSVEGDGADRHGDEGRQLAGRPIADIGHVVVEIAVVPVERAKLGVGRRELDKFGLEPLALEVKTLPRPSESSLPRRGPQRPPEEHRQRQRGSHGDRNPPRVKHESVPRRYDEDATTRPRLHCTGKSARKASRRPKATARAGPALGDACHKSHRLPQRGGGMLGGDSRSCTACAGCPKKGALLRPTVDILRGLANLRRASPRPRQRPVL